MTTTARMHPPITFPTQRRRPLIAAGAFVGAWAIGLTAFPAGPALDASSDEVARFYAQHATVTGVQSLVVHGLAPLALAGVFLAAANSSRAGQTVRTAGLAGVGLSFVQLTLGLVRSVVAETASASTTSTLVEAVNRLDGLKMLAFAVMATASAVTLRNQRRVGRPFVALAATAAVALLMSGAGYLFLDPTVGLTAFASLPLLLLWAGATGVSSSRRLG